ncbi:MAG: hypothetical protein ACLUFP_06930 [Streptococcus salivarius]
MQTVFFKGAGEATPPVNIQSDFTFTGKYNQAEDTSFDQDSYTFAKVNVPVIEGYLRTRQLLVCRLLHLINQKQQIVLSIKSW